MENKKKKILMAVSIIIFIAIALCGFLIVNNRLNDDHPSGKDPETNVGDNNQGGNGSGSNGNSGNNQGGNSGTGGNNQGGTGGSNQGGNSGNSSTGNGSSSLKLTNLSCTRTMVEDGVEMKDSLTLKYSATKGIQSDEVILTMKAATDGTKEQFDQKVDAYQQWFDKLKEVRGVTISSTKLDDKVIFNIKTDYTKLDYSKIDLTTGDGLHLYNVLQREDDLEFITSVLEGSLYSCQKVG